MEYMAFDMYFSNMGKYAPAIFVREPYVGGLYHTLKRNDNKKNEMFFTILFKEISEELFKNAPMYKKYESFFKPYFFVFDESCYFEEEQAEYDYDEEYDEDYDEWDEDYDEWDEEDDSYLFSPDDFIVLYMIKDTPEEVVQYIFSMLIEGYLPNSWTNIEPKKIYKVANLLRFDTSIKRFESPVFYKSDKLSKIVGIKGCRGKLYKSGEKYFIESEQDLSEFFERAHPPANKELIIDDITLLE